MSDIVRFPIPTTPFAPDFRTSGGEIQMRLSPADNWEAVAQLADLEGPQGIRGPQGDAVEIRRLGEEIQWRYRGDPEWAYLIDFPNLAEVRSLSQSAAAAAGTATTAAEAATAAAETAAGSATKASNMADAVAQATDTYTTVSAGLAATVDTDYFRVIEAPEAERVSVYRNDAGSATLITTYYTKTGVDAKQAAAVRLNRSLQRLGDHGQTLHSDFAYGAYGLGTPGAGGVEDALEGEELFTVERAASKWVFGPNGKLREVPPNTLARQWNPATGEPEGVLIEESRTNLLLWSEDFTQGVWRNGSLSVSADSAVAPTGGMTADKLIPDVGIDTSYGAVAAFARQDFTYAQAGTASTLTFFAKKGEYDRVAIYTRSDNSSSDFIIAGVDLASAEFNQGPSIEGSFTLTGSDIQAMPNGWVRVSISFVSGSDTTIRNLFIVRDSAEPQGDGTSGIYIWGAQLEVGSQPSSYIPTTDSPVTRAADNVYRTLGDEFKPSEGALFYEGSATGDNSYSSLLSISSGSSSNRILLAYSGSGGEPYAARCTRYDSSSNTNMTIGSLYPGDRYKAAVSYSDASGTISLACNGEVVTELAGFNDIQNLRDLSVGAIGPGGSSTTRASGSTSRADYYPRALTETELQELTQ